MVYEATLPIAQLVSRHRNFLFQLLKCFTSGDFFGESDPGICKTGFIILKVQTLNR